MSKRANSRPDGTNPEWTAEDFRNARPLMEALPKETVAAIHRMRGQRGPQKSPTKALISLRIDRDVLSALRATGLGWQTRANDALRAYVERDGLRARPAVDRNDRADEERNRVRRREKKGRR
jgi:uncharacterized protein (DUF4415 family)